jgi:adenosine deaminase CECR1
MHFFPTQFPLSFSLILPFLLSNRKMTVKVTSTFDLPFRYPSTAAFAASRKALLGAEHAAAFDYPATKLASTTEKKANKIVKVPLQSESDTIYGVHINRFSHEPTHQFRRARHLIDISKIFEIAKRAPKGALLHCHFDAMLPPSELISIANGMERYAHSD